jgi:hypothetical protein
MEEETKKGETPKVEGANNIGGQTPKKMRRIIIETDGNDIHLVSAEVSGKIELVGIFQGLIGYINSLK